METEGDIVWVKGGEMVCVTQRDQRCAAERVMRRREERERDGESD